MYLHTNDSGVSLSKHSQLTLQDRLEVKANISGIAVHDIQLPIVGQASIDGGDRAGVSVSNHGQASFTNAARIYAKQANAVILTTEASW